MQRDEPKLAFFLWEWIGLESREAVLKHADYDEEEHRHVPLQLMKSIYETHRAGGDALSENARRAQARQKYRSLRQGAFESLPEYKRRFSSYLSDYLSSGNVKMPDSDVAMDFFDGLDPGRYTKFQADVQNDMAKGIDAPTNLHDMYQRAANYLVVTTTWKPTGVAVFTTTASD